MEHLTAQELEAGFGRLQPSPVDAGSVELIVRRPTTGERETLAEATLDLDGGLVGDRWRVGRTPEPDAQLTLTNARVIELLAGSRERWSLAGDQLYVDLDLSTANVPPGTQLSIGSAEIEVTALPHTGCKKFAARYGVEAARFISTPEGKARCLRGINARVVQPGTVRPGDAIRKL